MQPRPTHCRFEHPGFAALGNIVFRLTVDDRIPAMALNVESTDVVLPLRGIANLLGLRPNGADAQMLHLIEQALRFVPELRIGDPLPSEVVTGEASWDPGTYSRQVASARLQMQLVSWIGGASDLDDGKVSAQMLLVSIDDPAIRPRVQEALRRAAGELGVPNGAAVAERIEALAHELAYIEALREQFLDRVRTMVRRLARVAHDHSAMAANRRETLFQVTRFGLAALAEITERFDEIDSQTAEILPALRNVEQQQTFIRPQRDRLYCLLLDWRKLLDAWDAIPAMGREPDTVWRVIDDSYRFLAPRYMTVQEWQTAMAAAEKTERGKAALIW